MKDMIVLTNSETLSLCLNITLIDSNIKSWIDENIENMNDERLQQLKVGFKALCAENIFILMTV